LLRLCDHPAFPVPVGGPSQYFSDVSIHLVILLGNPHLKKI
jgi:hypothetical protein